MGKLTDWFNGKKKEDVLQEEKTFSIEEQQNDTFSEVEKVKDLKETIVRSLEIVDVLDKKATDEDKKYALSWQKILNSTNVTITLKKKNELKTSSIAFNDLFDRTKDNVLSNFSINNKYKNFIVNASFMPSLRLSAIALAAIEKCFTDAHNFKLLKIADHIIKFDHGKIISDTNNND